MGYSELKAEVLSRKAYRNATLKVNDLFIKAIEEEIDETINSNKHSDKVIELLKKEKDEMVKHLKQRTEFMLKHM